MSTDLSASFNEQFTNINNKLKKRFMRKPNLSEAANEFVALAIQCENCEQPSFAGKCYIGAAKCESSAGNTLGEAEYYLAAARQFMKAEKKLYSLKFNSMDRENLESSIGCFIQALNKYPEKSTLRTAVYLELANELVILSLKREAIHYYEQALTNNNSKMIELMCLKALMNLQIDCGLYDTALHNANKIIDSEFKLLSDDIKSEVQISQILLASILQPEEGNRSELLENLFTNLLNASDFSDLQINANLRSKLQSIVLSYRTSDASSLVKLVADTKPLLTEQQRSLLENLVACDRQAQID